MNREDFAVQMDYVALLSKLVAPQALSLLNDTILFTGETPYLSSDLMRLLPTQVECYEDFVVPEFVPEGVRFSIVVIGRGGFSEEDIDYVLATSGDSPPIFLPQEGFLDRLLFGHDWWHDYPDLLNEALESHPSLRYAKSLSTFPWPTTEAEESSGAGESEAEFRADTRLHKQGYRITGLSRADRWEVLKTKAVPNLGLEEVATTIARHCRTRKRQVGGRQKFSHAITEWEHDLARLKTEMYLGHGPRFAWPPSEPW
jgi:hypothetical protein